MRSGFRHLSVILQTCLAFFSPWYLGARQQQEKPIPNSAPVIRSNVSEVLVPVVVRNAQGHAVGTLKKDDFQLFDDGRQQVISGFTVVKRIFETPGAAPPIFTPDAAAVAPRPPSPAQRFVVFLFDDLNLSADDLMRAQKAASKILEASLPDLDMAAVLSTSGTNSGLTRDHAKLRQTILNLKVNNLYGHNGHDCPNVDYYQGDLIVDKNDPQALEAAVEDASTCANLDPSMIKVATQMAQQAAHRAVAMGEQDFRTTLSFLRTVVSKMGALPGQRVLILVSPGFLTPGTEAMTLKSKILDVAAQANLTISAIDARGLYTTQLEASQQGAGSALAALLRTQYLQASMTASENVMAELADGTGGTYFHNNNNLEAGLSNLLAGPEYLYLLAFSTANIKFNGAYHNLNVKVNQNGVSVQARHGYFALEAEKTKK
jgi:VWFA-related protein